MKLGAPCFFGLESLQSLWCCDGVSAGVRHRSRVIYLGYCALSFIPKLLHMQHTVQDDQIWEMPSVTVAGTGAMVLMLAGIVSWCFMDHISEANIYIIEDPGASRRLFKFLACTTMVCYLYPVLFFGHAQLVAEGLLVIGGVYCLLWVPLMDSSSDTHCFVLFWCFLAILRLALVGAEFTRPMEYCLKLYIVEGAILRFLLCRYTKGSFFVRVEKRAPLCLQAADGSESRRQQFLQFFARPNAAERHTSLEAFDRLLLRLETQEGCVNALDMAFSIRQSWLNRRSLMRGQMIFTYHCICQLQFRADVVWKILEFAGDGCHSKEDDPYFDTWDASSHKDSAHSSLTSVEFLTRRLFWFLHQ